MSASSVSSLSATLPASAPINIGLCANRPRVTYWESTVAQTRVDPQFASQAPQYVQEQPQFVQRPQPGAQPAPQPGGPQQQRPGAPQAQFAQQPQFAPRPAQMQQPTLIIEDHKIRELSPEEQQSIRNIAISRNAITWDADGPFISVRSANTAERALARLKTGFATSQDGTRFKFANPFTRDGNPLTSFDTNAVHDIIAIDSIAKNADGTVAEGAKPNPPILLQLPTPKSDSIRRNLVSAIIGGVAYAPWIMTPVIGAYLQGAAGLALMARGATLALNPDTRNEAVATLTTGAKHFMFGAGTAFLDWWTMGTFSSTAQIVGLGMAAIDAAHAVGHALTKPEPIEIKPATPIARLVANVFSAVEWITKPLAGVDKGIAVRLRRMAAKLPFFKKKDAAADGAAQAGAPAGLPPGVAPGQPMAIDPQAVPPGMPPQLAAGSSQTASTRAWLRTW